MPNQNPICLDNRPTVPVVYNIAQADKEMMIYLTIKIEVIQKGWQYVSFNNISLKGHDIYPGKTPEPEDLKLDYGKNLHKKKCFIASHVSRFRTDSENDTPAIIKYTLIIEAAGKLLDEFVLKSDTNNPSNFYSFIIFNLLP